MKISIRLKGETSDFLEGISKGISERIFYKKPESINVQFTKHFFLIILEESLIEFLKELRFIERISGKTPEEIAGHRFSRKTRGTISEGSRDEPAKGLKVPLIKIKKI